MKLGLLGYGKMGKTIERLAIQRNHEIVGIGTREGCPDSFQSADVLIDFSHPLQVMGNVCMAASLQKSLVMGTTGWQEHLPAIKQDVMQSGIGFLHSANFSLGANLFFQVIKEAARRFSYFAEYDVGCYEAHHNQKADMPSGTGKEIERILKESYKEKERIQMASLRCGHITGIHQVLFDSLFDTIELTHTAKSREGFALGAILAAEWLMGKKGFYTLEDMFEELF